MHKEQNEVTWTPTSVSLLLDEDRIIKEWQAHGMQVHKVGHPAEWVLSAWNALAAVATDLPQVQSDCVQCLIILNTCTFSSFTIKECKP